MFEGWFTATELDKGTWMIKGADGGCTSYLLEGAERAILVDSGFGRENIRAFAQTLTPAPLSEVANTHGHFDHTGGNGWLETAYLSAEALEIARENFCQRELPAPYNPGYGTRIVSAGDRIYFGGRDLEVLPLSIHSPGSVAYLDRAHRILFTGDDIGSMSMLCYKIRQPQPSIALLAQALGRLMAEREHFDHICNGHGDGLQDGSLVNDALTAALMILNGTLGAPFSPPKPSPAESEENKPKFTMPEPEFKRQAEYGSVKLTYDVRYIHDYTRYTGLKGT